MREDRFITRASTVIVCFVLFVWYLDGIKEYHAKEVNELKKEINYLNQLIDR
jgi:Fe2+ transport system protein B